MVTAHFCIELQSEILYNVSIEYNYGLKEVNMKSMPGYDTFGPQYPPEWDEVEPEVDEEIFQIAEEYSFSYFAGRSLRSGSVWTKGNAQSGKSLKCEIRTADGRRYDRILSVKRDRMGEYLLIPRHILKDVRVRP